jgi:hypothetical protein
LIERNADRAGSAGVAAVVDEPVGITAERRISELDAEPGTELAERVCDERIAALARDGQRGYRCVSRSATTMTASGTATSAA